MKTLPIFVLSGLLAALSTAQEAAAPPPAADKKQGELITVTSEGGAEIDQEKNLMIYIDNVKFLHPSQGLEMTCQRLEVYRDPPPKPKAKPVLEEEAAKNDAPEAAPDAQPELREAIATGSVVIRKKGADGKTSIGKGQKAVFDGKKKVITLSGKPQPELDVGSDYLFYADTIILKEDGKHMLGNNARTVFKKQKDQKETKEGGQGAGNGR